MKVCKIYKANKMGLPPCDAFIVLRQPPYVVLLYPKQVSMCARSGKIEFVAVQPVDEQPVRLYVAFPMSGVLAR